MKLIRFSWFLALSVLVAILLPSARAQTSSQGIAGVGTWATQAEFKDIKIVKGQQTLYSSDFSNGLKGWKTSHGKWDVVDGALRQTSNDEGTRAFIGNPAGSDYTLSLKARKLSGTEGFLILFGTADQRIKSWWNLGTRGNTQHAVEAPGVAADPVSGTIETGRWYDIKVELTGSNIRFYLDNQLVQAVVPSPPQRDFGHALIPDLVADPSITEINGTFYIYATTDGAGNGLATSGLPVVWKSKDFLNWCFSGSLFPSDYDAKYWAPSAPVLKNGRYYLFPTLDNRITVLVSNSPDGPFLSLDGKSINKSSGWRPFPITVGHPIDADILHDDDGSYYMVWSQRYIARLNSDFTGFDGKPVLISTKRTGYSEGPALVKRNGIYYYFYTLGGNEHYQYAYMMSHSSPLGPWQAADNDIILTSDVGQGIFGPGHGCFFHPQGSDQWYCIYLEYGRAGTNRQIHADKLNFNPDGTIQPVRLTLNGVGAIQQDPNYTQPNLALAKHATASSTMSDLPIPWNQDARLNRIEGFSPENALDDSNGSRWMAASGDQTPWFQLDLGKDEDIHRTELYFVKPTAGHAYRLEYSPDGAAWNPYGGHDDIRVQSPHVDKKPVRARYLKLTILKGTPGLWDFRVY